MDEFSYKLTDTGVVLNPNDTSTLPFVDIVKVAGLDTPEIRMTERDHEGVDGGFLDAEFEKMRTVVLEGRVIGVAGSIESFLDELKANWAPRRSAVPFYFYHPGVEERMLFVKPLGCRYDSNELRRTGMADVQFICQAEDPRIYSNDELSVDVSQGLAIVTGLGSPFGSPFGFGDVVDAATTNVFNGGNRPTPALITIPGPVVNPAIYNDTTGNVLQVNLELTASDWLEIDLYYRTVKLNGTVSRRGYLQDPDWFMLEPGDNFLRYRATSSGNPDATVTYRYAWR